MTRNTFPALAILSASHLLYATYLWLGRPWGPSFPDGQRFGGGLLWAAGDLTLPEAAGDGTDGTDAAISVG